jgi:hypothetical protein
MRPEPLTERRRRLYCCLWGICCTIAFVGMVFPMIAIAIYIDASQNKSWPMHYQLALLAVGMLIGFAIPIGALIGAMIIGDKLEPSSFGFRTTPNEPPPKNIVEIWPHGRPRQEA